MFLADNQMKDKNGQLRIRTQFLVSDDDTCYAQGKFREENVSKLISNWTIAPYTHNVNPVESEIRRVMEGATVLLHGSDFPQASCSTRCTLSLTTITACTRK